MADKVKLTTPGEREAFYDAEIAPALLGLAKQCEHAGLSIVATVEWEPGEGGTTVSLRADRSISIEMAMVCARARSNADTMIMHLINRATKDGHNSMCLHLLGVPTTPTPLGLSLIGGAEGWSL